MRDYKAEIAAAMRPPYSGWSPLHRAAAEGRLDEVQRLLTAGSEINEGVSLGALTLCEATALHLAVYNCHWPVVEWLLDNGADPNIQTSGGFTAIHFAAINGYRPVVEWLLAKGADPRKIHFGGGFHALHFAAHYGHRDVVQYLVTIGIDLNEESAYLNETALHLAAREGHLNVVQWLVKQGADPNKLISGWRSFVDISGLNALHFATRYGHRDTVRWLLKNGADPNKKTKNADGTAGWNASHFAAREGHLDIMQELVRAGADPNVKIYNDRTALHWAVINGHLDMVRWLMTEGGARITEQRGGENLLQIAAKRRHFGIVRLLVGEFGMSPDSIITLPAGTTSIENWRAVLKPLFDMYYLKQQQSIFEYVKPNISVAVRTSSPLYEVLGDIVADYWSTPAEVEFSYTELEQHQQLLKKCLDWADTPNAWQRSAQELLGRLVTDSPRTVLEVHKILQDFLTLQRTKTETKAEAPETEIADITFLPVIEQFLGITGKYAAQGLGEWLFFQPPSLSAAQSKNNHELFQALQDYTQSSSLFPQPSDIDLAITLVEKILFQHSYSVYTINGIIKDSLEAYKTPISSELSGLIHRLLSATDPKKINSSLINRPFLARDKLILWQNEYLLRELKALAESWDPRKWQSKNLAKQLLDKISSQRPYTLVTIQQAIRDDLSANSKNPNPSFTESCRKTLANMERLKLLAPEKKQAPTTPPPSQATSYTTKGPTDNEARAAGEDSGFNADAKSLPDGLAKKDAKESKTEVTQKSHSDFPGRLLSTPADMRSSTVDTPPPPTVSSQQAPKIVPTQTATGKHQPNSKTPTSR